MSETRPRDPYVIPFAIAMVALFLSIATSMWTLSQSRVATDAMRTGTAGIAGPTRPGAELNNPVPDIAQPKLVLRSASASVSSTGAVTKYANAKPTVKPMSLDAISGENSPLNEAIVNLIPPGSTQKGLWCLTGGPWSKPNVATKKSGGAFVVDSSHQLDGCDGVFVASFDLQSGSPLSFTIDILWTDKS